MKRTVHEANGARSERCTKRTVHQVGTMVAQTLSERVHRSHDVSVHGMFRNTHDAGNGVMTHAFHAAQREGLALSIGEISNPPVEQLAQQVGVHLIVGSRRSRVHVVRIQERFVFPPYSLIAGSVVHQATSRLEHVRLDPLHVRKTIARRPQAHKRVLRDVVRDGLLPCHPADVSEHPLGQATEERLEGLGISLGDASRNIRQGRFLSNLLGTRRDTHHEQRENHEYKIGRQQAAGRANGAGIQPAREPPITEPRPSGVLNAVSDLRTPDLLTSSLTTSGLMGMHDSQPVPTGTTMTRNCVVLEKKAAMKGGPSASCRRSALALRSVIRSSHG